MNVAQTLLSGITVQKRGVNKNVTGRDVFVDAHFQVFTSLVFAVGYCFIEYKLVRRYCVAHDADDRVRLVRQVPGKVFVCRVCTIPKQRPSL